MIILLIFSTLLMIAYILLLLYYGMAWKRIPIFSHMNPTVEPAVFISVIIPARNEAENLPYLLASLSAQNYSPQNFEIIVINDFSTDNTEAIIKENKQVQLINLSEYIAAGSINSYKKKAIELGIKHCKGELIVTTDADCEAPSNWLQTIACFYETHKPELMVMPVAINCSLRAIEIFQALDFMTLQGITGAAVYKKMHSMCNGANLAYTRKAFDAVNGFKDIDGIASGDDMLLMHKIARQYPDRIAYLKSADVIVQTAATGSIKEFFNQRIRWASKADKYDDKSIFFVLLGVYLLNVVLLALPIIAFFTNDSWHILKPWLFLIFVKTVAELFFLYPVARFFKKEKLLWLFPLAQPFHIVYTVIAGWLGKFGSYEWKERKVK